MEIRQITFTDKKSSENLMVIETNEDVSNFLETFRLEVGEVVELKDGMYKVEAVSKKDVIGKNEISVDVEFIDLIENQPTA